MNFTSCLNSQDKLRVTVYVSQQIRRFPYFFPLTFCPIFGRPVWWGRLGYKSEEKVSHPEIIFVKLAVENKLPKYLFIPCFKKVFD